MISRPLSIATIKVERRQLLGPMDNHGMVLYITQLNPPVSSIQVRGFKDKTILQLRCEDCYYKKIDYRWWVLCPTHPRHRQREHLDDVKRKWIVTHQTIGGRPFQKKEEAYICNLAPPGPYDYRVKMYFKPDPKNVVIPKKSTPGLHRKLAVTPYNEPN